MKEDLKELLTEMNNCSKSLIDCLKIENYDNIQEFMDSRDSIINKIKELEFDKNDFKAISKEIGVKEMEEELFSALQEKKNDVKTKITELKKCNTAAKQYGSIGQGAKIFSKKI